MDLRLPDFICVGAQKSGTTWLYNELNSHDDIDLPETKEIRNFDPWPGMKPERYSTFFEPCKGLTGDFTPEYLTANAAPQIKELIPHCKPFCILRNPIDRAFSHWRMARKLNVIGLLESFEVCFSQDRRNMRSYGMYFEQVERYINIFGDQFKVFIYDDLVADPERVVKDICKHIGAKEVYSGTPWLDMRYKDDLMKITLYNRIMCGRHYKANVEKLEKLLGISTSWIHQSS